jgi:hypothetical protein
MLEIMIKEILITKVAKYFSDKMIYDSFSSIVWTLEEKRVLSRKSRKYLI